MAEAISVIGSAIALYQIADRVSQLLSKAKHLYQAPSELFALNNEISDLTVTLQNVEQCLSSNSAEGISLPENKIQHVCGQIDAAKKELLDLEQLIHYRFLRSGTLEGDFKVFRLRWAKSRSAIENHPHNLQRIRQNILMEMQVIGILHQTRTRLIIDQISVISSQVQVGQFHTNRQVERVLQELAAHSTFLNTILNDHAGSKGFLQRTTSNNQQAANRHAGTAIQSGIDIRAYVPAGQRRTKCGVYCRCKCHAKYSLKSAPVLQGFIGSLFIGYSGNPFSLTSGCTTIPCQGQVRFGVYVHYYFPSWFLRKVIDIEVISTISHEPMISLVVRGVQDGKLKINKLLQHDDVKGIQEMLSCGLARPNDIFMYNQVSLLEMAVNCGSINAVNFLLNAGANPNRESLTQTSAYRLAWNWILEAARSKTILEAFRSSFPRRDDMEDDHHFSRLQRVVLGLLDSRLEDELAADGLELDATDLEGMTALSWATRRNDLPAMDLLLNAKANPNISNNDGFSPLHYAANNLNPESILLLLGAGVDVRKVDASKSTPLHWLTTVHWGHKKITSTSQAPIECVKILVEAGINVNVQTVGGGTPLVWSTGNDDATIAEALLDHGAQMNIVDFDGDSPIANAIFYEAHNTARLLLQRGADYSIVSNAGNTILHHASQPRNLKVLEVLMAANLTGIDPNAVSKAGKTALELAQEHEPKPEGFIEAFQALLFGIMNRNDYA